MMRDGTALISSWLSVPWRAYPVIKGTNDTMGSISPCCCCFGGGGGVGGGGGGVGGGGGLKSTEMNESKHNKTRY